MYRIRQGLALLFVMVMVMVVMGCQPMGYGYGYQYPVGTGQAHWNVYVPPQPAWQPQPLEDWVHQQHEQRYWRLNR